MKKSIAFFCIIIVIIVLLNKHQNKDIFRSPTNEETNKYLTEQGISPLVIKNIAQWTLVLSENKFISLSVYKANGKMSSTQGSLDSNTTADGITTGLESWGNEKEVINVAAVIINNKSILEKANEVKIKLNSSDNSVEETKTELMNNKKGAIFWFANKKIPNGRLSEITIYDKKNKVIYHKNLQI